jgi:TIR domain
MAGGIFISYRRDDTRHVAGRLAGDLMDRFGAESIFRDIDSIDAGDEFPQRLDKALNHCVLMLVLIGRQWLGASDAQLRRRLDDPNDWVRLEIATALQRGIRVVPVMVEDTALPTEDQLPEDLRPLVRRQARMLSDARWRGDLQAMVDFLAKLPGVTLRSDAPADPGAAVAVPKAAGRRTTGVQLAVGTAALLVLAVGVGPLLRGGSDGPDLSGTWIGDDKEEVYKFVKQGDEYAVAVLDGLKQTETGTGRVTDNRLTLVLTEVPTASAKPDTYVCELTTADQSKTFKGACKVNGVEIKLALTR